MDQLERVLRASVSHSVLRSGLRRRAGGANVGTADRSRAWVDLRQRPGPAAAEIRSALRPFPDGLLLRTMGSTAVLCLSMAAHSLAAAPVRVDNATFEQADPTGRLPVGWAYIEPKDGEGSLALGQGHLGRHSAKVTCTQRTEGWGPGFG